MNRHLQIAQSNYQMKKAKVQESVQKDLRPVYPEIQNVVSFVQLSLPEGLGL